MNGLRVVDLHPEDLIERESLGLLDTSERTRLDAHVALCATCRFERQLRGDFAEELDAPNLPIASIGLVADVLARASGPSLSGNHDARAIDDDDDANLSVIAASARGANGPMRSRRRAIRAMWLLGAAALMLLAGGAAAALGLGARGLPALLGYAPRVSAPAAPAMTTATQAHAIIAAHSVIDRNAEIVAPVEPPAETAATVDAVAPIAHAAAPTALSHAQREARAQELFDAEAIARHHGDYARVFAVHRELDQRFPRSREAQVSRATVGQLLLDRGDPAGALANFDAYLAAGSGNLGEEAMVGRATALDRLGRTAEASTAWRALVAAFPDSPYAAHAKARVESLIGD